MSSTETRRALIPHLVPPLHSGIDPAVDPSSLSHSFFPIKHRPNEDPLELKYVEVNGKGEFFYMAYFNELPELNSTIHWVCWTRKLVVNVS